MLRKISKSNEYNAERSGIGSERPFPTPRPPRTPRSVRAAGANCGSKQLIALVLETAESRFALHRPVSQGKTCRLGFDSSCGRSVAHERVSSLVLERAFGRSSARKSEAVINGNVGRQAFDRIPRRASLPLSSFKVLCLSLHLICQT
jgi:hypothetical protein